ncbi:MAG: carboxymethylenebutenolidase [Chloroflexota bacterium]|jgi:dienelactone hydrolase|nr:carboxymethylenebutenolidase [Chloroflexota bacterium]
MARFDACRGKLARTPVLRALLIGLCLATMIGYAAAQDEGDTPPPDASGDSIAAPTATPVPTSPAITRQMVHFMSGPNLLEGYLWKPPGDGPFPVIIWNHGSEKNPATGVSQAQVFGPQGWAVFAPIRRGHGGSQGTYLEDAVLASPPADRSRMQVQLQDAEVSDQAAALDYLRSTVPWADMSHLADTGCSYGGIQTVLGVEANLGFKAGIALSPGAESWGNRLLQQRLTQAADNITVPMFFIHPQNDYTIQSGMTLAAEFQKLNKDYRLEIFPSVGTTPQEGHCFNGLAPNGARVWGPDAIQFLTPYLK